jgi:hypothetical protein
VVILGSIELPATPGQLARNQHSKPRSKKRELERLGFSWCMYSVLMYVPAESWALFRQVH